MDLNAIVARAQSIFSLPEVVYRVNELISSGNTTNQELEQTILNDPALTAKLLKLANSPYFGFSKKIETVSYAIALIGHRELRNLALASSVTTVFKGISSDLINMESFWHHSISSGITARLMAYDINCRERMFIAGLLHGIGRLILINQFPEESSKILCTSEVDENTIAKAELHAFGFTSTELCAAFLKEWNLPASIWKTVACQRNPTDSEQLNTDAYILHLAIIIARYKQNHRNREINSDDIKSLCKPEIYQRLGLDDEVIELINTVAELQINEMLNCIKPGTTVDND
ncbi:HDOD domain-containing protein [Nitrosomonas sp.]|uniref:HDOD domain-containing protein n=1 Tax=Nitrosomonas sp. TaxID=42353 RepID=UPI001D6ECA76|nr:HDOD domain-containing protein [Nitrosomonas sp.]MCB1947889.1 HDOD domain-containing protein [Nitrosomonas sp.]MCP5242439.1 HDOD domain-containing protein [Burkholderiales bacterium]MDR4515224.1 HDOD domain-containing protein [Nitrosomonas sp.]